MQEKSNKTDLEGMYACLSLMHSQFQSLIVLMIESIKLTLREAGDTRQGREKRSKDLISQIKSLQNWAHKLDIRANLKPEDLPGDGPFQDGGSDDEVNLMDTFASVE